MSSKDATGIKHSVEEASLHANDSGRDLQQPSIDHVTLPMILAFGLIVLRAALKFLYCYTPSRALSKTGVSKIPTKRKQDF
jgi:hypothetical protein